MTEWQWEFVARFSRLLVNILLLWNQRFSKSIHLAVHAHRCNYAAMIFAFSRKWEWCCKKHLTGYLICDSHTVCLNNPSSLIDVSPNAHYGRPSIYKNTQTPSRNIKPMSADAWLLCRYWAFWVLLALWFFHLRHYNLQKLSNNTIQPRVIGLNKRGWLICGRPLGRK